jgi:two-component system cell cycle response regulator DivK
MNRTILVVDDDAMNRKLLTDLLGMKGYDVLAASDGGAGMGLARTHLPGLILMDVRMPVMDGFALAVALKSDPRTRPLTIWALTANAMRDDESLLREQGCDSYLTKPLDLRDLLARIERHFSA